MAKHVLVSVFVPDWAPQEQVIGTIQGLMGALYGKPLGNMAKVWPEQSFITGLTQREQVTADYLLGDDRTPGKRVVALTLHADKDECDIREFQPDQWCTSSKLSEIGAEIIRRQQRLKEGKPSGLGLDDEEEETCTPSSSGASSLQP